MSASLCSSVSPPGNFVSFYAPIQHITMCPSIQCSASHWRHRKVDTPSCPGRSQSVGDMDV